MRIFLVLALLLFNLQAKSLFSNNNQAETGKYIMALKDLIVSAQKTRGATLGYINGNKSALLLIHNFRDDMKKAIGHMESLPLAKDPMINSRATLISNAFTKLNSKALKMSSDEAFDAYTETIAQALMLAQTVSKSGSESMNDFGKKVSVIMMETIMPLSEWMGEQRALGSGASAKGLADETLKVKMKVLLRQIDSLNNTLQSQMRSVVNEKPDYYNSNVNAQLLTAQQKISKYVGFSKRELFKKDINVDSNDYFDMATDAISTIIVLFNMNSVAIEEDSKGWI